MDEHNGIAIPMITLLGMTMSVISLMLKSQVLLLPQDVPSIHNEGNAKLQLEANEVNAN